MITHGRSFQHCVEPHPTPCPPRRPVVTATCCRPHSHCAWVPKGPWVVTVSTMPGCCETTMNHQNATVAPRLTTLLLPIVSSAHMSTAQGHPFLTALTYDTRPAELLPPWRSIAQASSCRRTARPACGECTARLSR